MNDQTATVQPPVSEPPSPPQPSRLQRFWQNTIRPIAVLLLVLFAIRSAVADWNDVPTQSMEPTVLVGDRIFVNKLAYDLKIPFTLWRIASWSDPQPGDVVVFFAPGSGNDQRMVKRIVGVPGDTIEVRRGRLLINGSPTSLTPLNQSAIDLTDLADPPPHLFATEALGNTQHPVMAQPNRPAPRNWGPVIVPPDQFVVLGDNRDNSGDSRIFGLVERRRIVGKAVGIAFSLDRQGGFSPRWDRFFHGLP